MRRFIYQLFMFVALMALKPDQRALHLEALALGFDAYEAKHEAKEEDS